MWNQIIPEKGVPIRIPPVLLFSAFLLSNPSLLSTQTLPDDAQPNVPKKIKPAPDAAAQAKPTKPNKAAAFQGTISSIAADKSSFTITDKNGTHTTLKISPATTYQLDKNTATFDQAVRVGLSVKGDLASDGTVLLITAKTAQNTLDQLQPLLAASDEEWQFLRPLIETIQKLQNQLSAANVSTTNLAPPAANQPPGHHVRQPLTRYTRGTPIVTVTPAGCVPQEGRATMA